MTVRDFRYYSLKDISDIRYIYYEAKICRFLFFLNFEYPDFYKWYDSLYCNTGLNSDRDILFYLDSNDNIAAVAILKNNIYEKKICTLRVAKKYQGIGLGSALFEKSFEYLATDKPLITIHLSKYSEFKNIFKKYNFSLEEQFPGYYGFLRSELVFNGTLSNQNKCISFIDNLSYRIERSIFESPVSKKVIYCRIILFFLRNIFSMCKLYKRYFISGIVKKYAVVKHLKSEAGRNQAMS